MIVISNFIGFLCFMVRFRAFVWSAVLQNGVQAFKRNFVLADRLVEVNAGVLELVSPEYLTGQVGGPHLDVVPRLRRRSLHC